MPLRPADAGIKHKLLANSYCIAIFCMHLHKPKCWDAVSIQQRHRTQVSFATCSVAAAEWDVAKRLIKGYCLHHYSMHEPAAAKGRTHLKMCTLSAVKGCYTVRATIAS
eukprot:GHRR01036193.1.p1 GENE.GHRR01036193.1~~GHRR01036193.1.p1  ORF type:complete len:109 (+),score=26.61 GHRR01036193.1:55-381(+)